MNRSAGTKGPASLADLLFGRTLASGEERAQRIGPVDAIPIFGLDALSSAAYGPEAALTVLLPLGTLGVGLIMPISGAIVALLLIVFLSYRQTIGAYPGGGGSYTVARENLGAGAGLLAAAALMIDYILNVAVGISAGVGALVSGVPALQPHTLALCLVVLVLLTLVNLRGVREAGLVFQAPTYLFVGCLLAVVGWGVVQSLAAHGHPRPLAPHPPLSPPHAAIGAWIILKAFASGCTAMTGVEAVSNGVQAFREPVVRLARTTLTIIIAILAVLLLGIAYLAHAYQIGATVAGVAGYQSVLSQLTLAVMGRGWFYVVAIGSILGVLCLSANTSFADFPRLCRVVAVDGYLPRAFTNRGRRLVYSAGVWVLAALSAVLLVLFEGVTDRLIPLFAVGAFLAFTFSQAGMVGHWMRVGGSGARRSVLVNGIGAMATGATALIVLAAKFVNGAWVIVLLAPAMLGVMVAVRRHYERVERETAPLPGFLPDRLSPPIVIVPVESWNTVTQKALRLALALSGDVQMVHVESDEDPSRSSDWVALVEDSIRATGMTVPGSVLLRSPYRYVIQPILDHVLSVEREHPHRVIAVIIPELVERRWYHYFLHNQRAHLLAALLLLKGERRIVVVNVPWYLKD